MNERKEKKQINTAAYFLFNEKYSGIIESQAIDVVRWLGINGGAQTSLIHFLPFRNTKAVLSSMRAATKGVMMVTRKNPPTLLLRIFRLWNVFRLYRVLNANGIGIILCRGIVSCEIALSVRKWFLPELKVCYDGRGAALAEQREFGNMGMTENQAARLEKKAVFESNARISVSQELVEYWKKEYDYEDLNHVVIPTTLNSSDSWELPHFDDINKMRREHGIQDDDVVFVYSGSLAGWQGEAQMFDFARNRLRVNDHEKFFFLSKEGGSLNSLIKEFPNKVSRFFVSPHEVRKMLVLADYALLFRDDRVTNQVASPTKFAEYLSCGLPVLVSGNPSSLRFVNTHKCGRPIVESEFGANFKRVDYSERLEIHGLAKDYFDKSHYLSQYRQLFV
jgi:hypothetical protein